MKRNILRKRSKSKATLDKTDKAVQDFYRDKFPKRRCEVCGGQYQVIHHHNEKSKSNAGRFCEDNFVFLCHKCHAKIIFGDNNVVATYSVRRGMDWVKRMEVLKKVPKQSYTKKELEGIIEKYG